MYWPPFWKTPDKCVEDGGLILVYSLRGYSLPGERQHQQLAGHTVSFQEVQTPESHYIICFLLSIQSGTLAHGMVSPSFRDSLFR